MFMESFYKYLWVVPACPFITSGSIGLVSFVFPRVTRGIRHGCAIVSILSLTVAMYISFTLFQQQIVNHSTYEHSWSWILNDDISIRMGLLSDPLTSIMSILVTTVGILVMIYSDSYMYHDQGYVKFFVYLSLFAASMLGLVLSPNLLQIYFFWELVGMCSYLLIGFWFARPSAANACQKAFVTNRIGDFGLLLGILGIYWITGSFEIHGLCDRFNELTLNSSVNYSFANICALLLFLGPVAKSAQFPLHVWLCDAMEGPTPISALIHAATMVAAGIFLVARIFKLFEYLPLSMSVISWVGGITALLGATVALVQKDLKKGLAYSTMSQLGYMMLALGIGAYQSALFHLITHAYSKALLFLGSGSVIHSMERFVGYSPTKNQDMLLMGGLRRYMPITGTTFLLGTLSLCGIPPLACFWSKDQIIAKSWLCSSFFGCIASFTAVLTGFYMFRIYLLTFEGDFRVNWMVVDQNPLSLVTNNIIWGNSELENPINKKNKVSLFLRKERIDLKENFIKESKEKTSSNSKISCSYASIYPKESGSLIILPLVILSIPTLLIGLIGIPFSAKTNLDFLSEWLTPLRYISYYEQNSESFLQFLVEATGSVSLSLVGILISYIIYGPMLFFRRKDFYQIFKEWLNPVNLFIQDWSRNQGYFDYYYDIFFIRGIRSVSKLISMFDEWVIDGMINGIGISSFLGGEGARYGEGGRVSSYLFGLMIGTVVLLIVFISLVS
uniref:NAD(P)H-quinone oxidoreductase subunit 5, chloroplastic n=1 Tax=Trichomanes trollii TaxID=1481379 RepID=A0A410YEJ8_9MONI|nr:NADH-plastoquinone oxidoreductase subunit 5 [Trichomanes trollii]QAV57617.1 NADH-plastoquinone oxidoreductase subunit 5 [Trichomanes trollii]